MNVGTLFTAIAYIVGIAIFHKFTVMRDFSPRDTRWLAFAALLGGVIGAKLVQLMIVTASGANPVSVLVHPDGRTIIGGLFGGWAAVEFAKKILHIKRPTGDGFALAMSLGESIGRIGCFFNGCCFGAAAHLPWAVYQCGTLRHPAQIYSALTSFAIFCLLLSLKSRVKYEGDLFRIYVFLFGFNRFILEFFRERTAVFFGLSVAQWLSIELMVTMILSLGWLYLRPVSTISPSVESE